jgi:hypothetical protein
MNNAVRQLYGQDFGPVNSVDVVFEVVGVICITKRMYFFHQWQ